MRALQITELTGPRSALAAAELPDPPATHLLTGRDEVVVEVHAAGVSFPELLQTRGQYQLKPPTPFVPGSEVAGVVRSAPAHADVAPGDRVAAFSALGGWAETAVAPGFLTFRLPDELSFAQGAGLILNYHTAYFALRLRGRLRAGETVLVHGAAGGVGTAAIQVANGLGARTIAVVSSDEKEHVARTAGADEVVRSDGAWKDAAKELTGGAGVDVVLDEARVTRHLKKGRIVAIERIQPPKGFTAGSILDRQASLLTPAFTEQQYTAFRKPKIEGKEIDIALAFHMLKPKTRDIGVSTMVASLINNEEGDSLALGYAATEPDYAEDSPFDSILTKPKPKRFVPKLNGKAHSWATNVLPPHVFTEKEQKCLANAIYFEAANEPLKGRAAVAQVILNRVRNPTFPDTICGVVYQNEHWRNRCQFSFACDRIPDIVWSREKYKAAKEIALAVTAGKIYLEEVGDSTHYHATYVRPAWARTMTRVSKIGLHIFYRTRNGGWT